MAFGNAIQNSLNGMKAAGSPVGSPPLPRKPVLGGPPAPAQPHIAPAPYDAAMDPAWKAVVPNIDGDHELRNFLNGLSPEERQMLLKRIGGMAGGAPPPPVGGAPAPPAMPAGMPPALGV